MGWIGLIFGLVCSGLGIWLLVQALMWRSKAVLAEGELVGFLNRRSRGKKIPVFKLEDESAVEIKSAGVIIDNLGFWLKPIEKGDVFKILYFRNAPEKCVVHGYMNFVGAFFLQWPLLFYYASNNFDALVRGQFAFLFVLFCVVALMWLFLRIVRYYY